MDHYTCPLCPVSTVLPLKHLLPPLPESGYSARWTFVPTTLGNSYVPLLIHGTQARDSICETEGRTGWHSGLMVSLHLTLLN